MTSPRDTDSTRNLKRPRHPAGPDASRGGKTGPQVAPRAGGNRRVVAEPVRPAVVRKSRLAALREWVTGIRWSRAHTLLAHVGRLTVVVAVLGAAGAGGRLAERYVRSSPAFAIRTVSVTGLGLLEREELLRVAGVEEGRNVFELPPEDIRARLLRHPWIATASVRRRLPGTVEIAITERRALAMLLLDDLYLVGEDATVFKTRERADPSDLPIITVAEPRRWLTDRAAFSTLLLDIVALVQDYRRTGLAGTRSLEELHVEADDGISLFVGATATRVALGRSPYERKLRRLRSVFEELRRRNSEPEYVLLDHERRQDRVVVRLRETLVPLPLIEEPVAPNAPEARGRRT